MRISDWSSDVCSSDLGRDRRPGTHQHLLEGRAGGTGHLPLHRLRSKDAVLGRGEAAGEPGVGQHDDPRVIHDLLDVLHERREIGSASVWDKVGKNGITSVVAVDFKKKKRHKTNTQ